MLERIHHGKIIWLRLQNPTTDEIKTASSELNIPPSLVGDLSAPIPRNYACLHGDIIKIVLDFPVVKRIDVEHPYEVKFIISKNSLLTVQYEEMGGIDKFRRQAEVVTTLRKPEKMTGVDLFISLTRHLHVNMGEKLDYLESKLTDVESSIFSENEKEMVFSISDISKKLISVRHILGGHNEIWNDVLPLFSKQYKAHFDTELNSLYKQYLQFIREANMLNETLNTLRDTNTAMLFTKQNEVMKIFTIMAFVTFPLSLLSSIFGMNTISAPIVGEKGDFWIIIAIMLVAMACFFSYFKHKKWI